MAFPSVFCTESTFLIYSMHSGNTILICLQYAWKLQQNSVSFGLNTSLCPFAQHSHNLMFLQKKQIPIILSGTASLRCYSLTGEHCPSDWHWPCTALMDSERPQGTGSSLHCQTDWLRDFGSVFVSLCFPIYKAEIISIHSQQVIVEIQWQYKLTPWVCTLCGAFSRLVDVKLVASSSNCNNNHNLQHYSFMVEYKLGS